LETWSYENATPTHTHTHTHTQHDTTRITTRVPRPAPDRETGEASRRVEMDMPAPHDDGGALAAEIRHSAALLAGALGSMAALALLLLLLTTRLAG
jgi:hypothetical protein